MSNLNMNNYSPRTSSVSALTNLRISYEMLAALDAEARRSGRTRSSVIRDAVDEHLQRRSEND